MSLFGGWGYLWLVFNSVTLSECEISCSKGIPMSSKCFFSGLKGKRIILLFLNSGSYHVH